MTDVRNMVNTLMFTHRLTPYGQGASLLEELWVPNFIFILYFMVISSIVIRFEY
jgi:hypothetical protein